MIILSELIPHIHILSNFKSQEDVKEVIFFKWNMNVI